MHIQPADDKKWSELTLEDQQIDVIRQYLRNLQATPCDQEAMLGFNGLDASRETWHPCFGEEDQRALSSRIQHGLSALGLSSEHAVKFHNELMDDLHLTFMNNLRKLSVDIEARNTTREKPFRSYDPALMEASVSI